MEEFLWPASSDLVGLDIDDKGGAKNGERTNLGCWLMVAFVESFTIDSEVGRLENPHRAGTLPSDSGTARKASAEGGTVIGYCVSETPSGENRLLLHYITRGKNKQKLFKLDISYE